MKKLQVLLIALLALCASRAAHATTNCDMASGASVSTIQGAINAAAANTCTVAPPHVPDGHTLYFDGGGSWTISSQVGIPCPTSAGLLVTGPTPSGVGTSWPITPTPILTSTLTNNWAFSGTACGNGTTIRYLQYNGNQPSGGGGAFLFVPPGMNNLTVIYNWFYGVSALQNSTQPADTFITLGSGSTGAARIQNTTIQWNRFGSFGTGECGGQANSGNQGLMNLYGGGNHCSGSGYQPPSGSTSCLYQGAIDITHGGGSCGGIGVNNNYDNLKIKNNSFTDLEQPIKLYEAPSGNWSSTNLLIQANDLAGTHRIGNEAQSSNHGSGPNYSWDSNSFHDPIKPNSGMWGLSLPLGGAFGTDSTNNVLVGNVAPSNDKNGQGGFYSGCGIEFWGTGTSSQNLIQGNWCAGIQYGFGGGGWSANNNVNQIIAPHASQCIVSEGLSGAVPSQTGNICSSTLSALTSTAPSIFPASGATPLTVTLSDPGITSGAGPRGNTSIWYTTDGTTPVPGQGTTQFYAGPFTLNTPTVKAVGMWGALNQPLSYPSGYGFVPSAVVTSTFTSAAPAATPVFSPGSSSFATSLSVSISDATAGATIYYTVDGSAPTTSSTVYSGPITVTGASTVIKAMAIKSGFSQSATASATYTSTSFVSTPTFAPSSGTTFTSSVSVSISDITPSSTIYYTTDGTTPTTGSTVYSSALTISATTTVKALAAASGLTNSSVGSATYSLVGPTVTDTPTASPAAGSYFSTQSVSLSDTTAGASICYTTDGTTPAASTPGTCSHGTTYSGAITVSSSETIRALGTLSGKTNSPVAVFAYVISAPTPAQRGNIDYTQIKQAERLGPGNFFQMANKGTYSAVNAATPCSSTNEGATASVSDSNTATFGASIAGGGSNHVHAYCNGTAWVVN